MPDIHPAMRAQLDGELASALSGLIAKAAEHDGEDIIEANVALTEWLDVSPLSRLQLAAAVAMLALRTHRAAVTP